MPIYFLAFCTFHFLLYSLLSFLHQFNLQFFFVTHCVGLYDLLPDSLSCSSITLLSIFTQMQYDSNLRQPPKNKSVLRKNILLLISYEVVSKIFRTDAVKIVKLTLRPIGRCHPQSSSLLHVDTGPTSPPFLDCFLEVLSYQSVEHSLQFGLYLLNGIKPASFQLKFHFWK